MARRLFGIRNNTPTWNRYVKGSVPDRPRNIVGPNVRRIRSKRGLSQAQLVAMCQRSGWDISREILAKIEAQIRWVSDFELLLLAAALRVPVTELLPPLSTAKAMCQDKE